MHTAGSSKLKLKSIAIPVAESDKKSYNNVAKTPLFEIINQIHNLLSEKTFFSLC
jgi:hypothetical protein